MDHWKLLLSRGSGGWTAPKENTAKEQQLPAFQLYDMATDPAESQNLGGEQREIAHQLYTLLRADIERGRTTTGPESTNDTEPIQLWKSGPPTPDL